MTDIRNVGAWRYSQMFVGRSSNLTGRPANIYAGELVQFSKLARNGVAMLFMSTYLTGRSPSPTSSHTRSAGMFLEWLR